MGKFKLIEVATKSEIKQWLDFPAKLYEQDPHYVRPMDDEEYEDYRLMAISKRRREEEDRDRLNREEVVFSKC